MSRDWIIESLAELKAHAQQEGLPALAEQLDIAIQVAMVEMAQPRPPIAQRIPGRANSVSPRDKNHA